MTKPVITRFAPSPTGFLHIGGARTALFNWLFAKANGGKMLLRIEDTDRARSTQEAVDAIMDGLTWLGLDWDGEAISQFGNAARHQQVAHQMIAKGSAYKCICTPEKLDAMREKAKAEGRPLSYDRTCRTRPEGSIPDGTPFVIRLKAPLESETLIHDQVQGDIRIPNKDLDDLVLLRSDGTPTYMLAVVVDDHDMNVSHIIRGDDHLINAARQTLIYQGMGWEVPTMAHIPLIHGSDGAKLSKRHGAIGAETYRALGYLPEAIRNYLVRLGWSHGDTEIMSTEEMISWFGFSGMNKAAARFDFAKLEALNSHYMRAKPDDELLMDLLTVLEEVEDYGYIRDNLNEQTQAWLLKAMPALKERAKTLLDIAAGSKFLFDTRPLVLEEKAAKLLDENAKQVIAEIIPPLQSIEDWGPESISDAIKGFAAEKELKLGQVAQPIRAALTGKATSPGAFDVLNIFGKSESLARMHEQL
ncbi:MAG: glutamate--tRNA ligase [Pseudomonadota bacterium]